MGSGSYTSDTYFRKVMNIFANHSKCPLKAPVFELINGKEKYIRHSRNKTGKFVSIACISPLHTCGKKSFFNGICKFLHYQSII